MFLLQRYKLVRAIWHSKKKNSISIDNLIILMEIIAEGLSCSSKLEAIGEFIFVETAENVINLFDKANGKIVVCEDAGTTTLGPILPDLAGIVCTTGSAGSHLAIVSREFELPCVMSAEFVINDLITLSGKTGKIMTEGDDKGIVYITK